MSFGKSMFQNRFCRFIRGDEYPTKVSKVFAALFFVLVILLTAGNAPAQTFPITFDATALSATHFNIIFGAAGGGPNQVTTFRLIPGTYTFHVPASTSDFFFFEVTSGGTVDYAPALDVCVSGRGTNRLTLLCDPAAPNHLPVCHFAQAVPHVLWPPNHRMVPVSVAGVTDPDGNSVAITITGVTQDEPVNGLGDGDLSPDAVLQGSVVLVRAERSGTGNGRVYRVQFMADDNRGGTCTGSVSVGVPHNRTPGLPIIDDGQLYDSSRP